MAARLTFRPSVTVTIAAVAACVLFARLGVWQLDRAAQKHREYEQFLEHTRAAPVRLQDPATWHQPAAGLLWRQARLEGHYLAGTNVVLDNQADEGRPGYRVFTPFRLANQGPVVLIDRGWRANPAERDRLQIPPPAAAPAALSGTIAPPPAHGLRLPGDTSIEDLGEGVRRVQLIDPAVLAQALRLDLLPYVVLLDPAAPDGFVRRRQPPGSDEGRSQSYAVQWFVMATTVAVLYLYLNLKRRS